MDVSLLLYYISGFPKEMLVALLVFVLPLKRREDWLKRLPLSLLALAGCIALDAALWFPLTPMLSSQSFFALHYLFVCALLTWGTRRVFDVSWGEAFYCIVCSYIAEHMVYCAGNLILHFGGLESLPAWIDLILHVLIYVALHLFFARKMCEDGHYATNSVQSVGLMVAVFTLVYVMSLFAIDLGLEWMHACYALICLMAMLVSEYRYTSLIRSERTLREKEHLWQMNRAQYEMSRQQTDAINRKCHDLKHQIVALRAMDDQKQRSAAIESMEEAVMFYDSAYQTGNRTLDMALTQKALSCNQRQIPLSVIADGNALRFMDDIDLYTLIANILDNAIEANERIADPQRRNVSLSIHEKKGLVILQAENPFAGELKMKDGLPQTSKADRENHGFGTRSIAYTVEKYDGLLSIRAENGMFVLRTAFPVRAENCISGRKSA